MSIATESYAQAAQIAQEAVDDECPIFPLGFPALAGPGVDFMRVAAELVGEVQDPAAGKKAKKTQTVSAACGERLRELYRSALYDPDFSLEVTVKGKLRTAQFLPGNLWGREADGPRRAPVMVIGKHPGVDELQQRQHFVGQASDALHRAVSELDIDPAVYRQWYLTCICKHNKLDPSSGTIAASWLKNCLPLLQQEVWLVQPDYICCLGAEAAKALLGDKSINVSDYFGHCVDYTYPIDCDGTTKTAKLMVITNPGAVFHNPDAYEDFLTSFTLFSDMIRGVEIGRAEEDIDHRIIQDVETLNATVDELLAAGFNTFAVDAEWHGDKPFEPNAYLRCIQVSWAPKCSFLVDLRGPGGVPSFMPGAHAAVEPLKRLLKSTPGRRVSVGGHFFRADLPWLMHMGLDLRAEYAPPTHTKDQYGWERAAAGVGGFDTGLMLHAVNEVGPFNLEHNATRLCRVPRYDVHLERWKIGYCRQYKLKPKQLEGYGECPSEVLYPYGNYDADATFRIFKVLTGDKDTPGLLDQDRYGNDSWEPYWRNHRASLGVLEMELTGIPVDMARSEELIDNYAAASADLLARLRDEINWPDFNPKSVYHCRELLYGHLLNGSIDKANYGRPKRLRPDGAKTLNLSPVKASGKGAKEWPELVARNAQHNYNPSTDRETLGILVNTTTGENEKPVRLLRDLRFLGQILQSALRLPTKDADGEVIRDDDGDAVFDAGLLSFVNRDGRVRTRMKQTLETGRAATANPNLQNISKRREEDYARILGPAYLYPIRSILCASPGCVLVEADIKSAELAGMAWLSGDEQMTEDVRRNCLPEAHPDYFEIHSNTAVQAFRLDCPPTKDGLKSIGKKHLRVAAKNVNFGIPYGRGSVAICRQCKEEGTVVSVEEADELRQYYFTRYPRTEAFLAECRSRSQRIGWMRGAFGRFRRFPATDDRKIQGDQERQACNFPIQNLVADAVWEMLYQLMWYREQKKIPFRLVLQIHDAVLFEVPLKYLEDLVLDVIPQCMSRSVPIYPCTLDGRPRGDGPFYFGIDTELYINWGVELTAAQIAQYSIPQSVLAH